MALIGIAMLLVLFLMISGVPILYSFMSATLFMVFALDYDPSFLLTYGYSVTGSIVLLCVPLYVCVGSIMNKSELGRSLIDFVNVFVGRVKGGLGIVGVFASAVFGSISGSSTATLTCIGSIILPRMYEKGYPRGHAAALLTNACPLGLLIPPSSTMILYAWVSRQSILACFLATVLPGICLAILLSLTNVVLFRNTEGMILENPIESLEDRVKLIRDKGKEAIPALLMPIIILGGTYSGVFTPTESAAIAVFYAIPVGFWVYKKLTIKGVCEAFVESATTTGVVMVMVFCMMTLSRILIMMNLPEMIIDFMSGISKNPKVVLLFINILLLFLGMIMDDTSAMLLTVPILVPIAQAFSISPIHLAAVVGVNLGLGIITPPCAPCLLYTSPSPRDCS